MKIPYYNPGRRSLTFTLFLLLVLLLMVLTGLGVFRLYFAFEWVANENDAGQLFRLNIRGGHSFNLFSSPPFGYVFWLNALVMVILAVLMPKFRIVGGTILAMLACTAIFLIHDKLDTHSSVIPMEFELLIVLVLYVIYVLLNYIREVRDRKRFDRLLSQYVPEELAEQYRLDPQMVEFEGEEREVTVIFVDVVGFSSIAEQLNSSQLALWLNLYFTFVSRIVIRYRGMIDKYMGDSVMAVWGAPARNPAHAYDALCASLDILEEIDKLNKQYAEKKLPSVTVGIGISSGLAMVGPLGSEYRMDYTVVGDTVNIAERLQAQTRKYPVSVIVSDHTVEMLPDMLFRELDTVMVKGKKQPVTMFEPLGAEEQASDVLIHWLDLHKVAMQATKSSDWDKAIEVFTQLRDEWGPSGMYELYLRGIELAKQTR